MKLLVNVFGAPKSGKTTMMASITAFLKLHDIKCEMAADYPKEILYEERFSLLKRQLYILAKQEKRIYDLYKFSDVVITDCPILHSIVYNHDEYRTLHPFVVELHESYNNLNIIMERTKQPDYGCFKIFTPDQIRQIEVEILQVVSKYEHHILTQEKESIGKAIDIVAKTLNIEV
jgi:tRNA uridine 5-carbamoylmethylation protein Kti12